MIYAPYIYYPFFQVPLLNTFVSEQDGAPSSVDFIRDHPIQIVAAYNSSHSVIFDIETAKPVVRLESGQEQANAANKMINKIVSHPTLPLTITAHEDRHIRFWDNMTGKMVHSMVAHLDAVTSLAVDPNGLYLLSGTFFLMVIHIFFYQRGMRLSLILALCHQCVNTHIMLKLVSIPGAAIQSGQI